MTNQPHDDVEPGWCPDCGTELSFTGIQAAGVAQFFCEICRYRHDRFVGRTDATA